MYALFLNVPPVTLFLGLHLLQLQGAEVGVVVSVVDSVVDSVADFVVDFVVDSLVDSVVTKDCVGVVCTGSPVGCSLGPLVDSAPSTHGPSEELAGKK